MWSAAIIQLLISAFKQVLISPDYDFSWNDIFFKKIDNLSFHGSMYNNSIFIYATLAVSLLYFIYIVLSPNDLKFVLSTNQKKMKTYSKFNSDVDGKAEPLVDK